VHKCVCVKGERNIRKLNIKMQSQGKRKKGDKRINLMHVNVCKKYREKYQKASQGERDAKIEKEGS
jgi:hypothetical protein